MDGRKRGLPEAGFNNANGGFKKSKQEMESFSTGVGSKSKPCTKFFSTSGCPFGDNCHFQHYVPGGYNAVAPMMGQHVPASPRNNLGPGPGRFTGRGDPNPGHASSFGMSATAKISVDASLAGGIIGKAGMNSKQISRETGAKLSIRDHEVDPGLKNIELEGTFEQIKEASSMVRELIGRLSAASGSYGRKPPGGGGGGGRGGGGGGGGERVVSEGKPHPGGNYRTKMCERYLKGSCSFGDRCHFAHGEADMRRQGFQ